MNARKEKAILGSTHIFPLEFNVYVDKNQNHEVMEVDVSGHRIRVYPLFRVDDANFNGIPQVSKRDIPVLSPDAFNMVKDESFKKVAVYLPPRIDGGDISAVFCAGEKFEKDMPSFPMNAIRIDIYGNENIQDPAGNNAFALKIVELLIKSFRQKTGQWWIGHGMRWWSRNLNVSALVNEHGVIIEIPWINGSFSTPTGKEKPLTASDWQECVEIVGKNGWFDQALSLYMDALYYHASRDFAMSVLMASLACEIGRDQALERAAAVRSESRKFRKGRLLKDNDLRNHLSRDFKEIFDRSLRDEKPLEFKRIEDLWKIRHNVAHKNKAFFQNGSEKMDVNYDFLVDILKSVQICLEWLEKIT